MKRLRNRRCTLWLGLGLGAAGAMVSSCVSSGGIKTSSLASCCLQRQGKRLLVTCYAECFCTGYVHSHNQHAHTQDAPSFDAHLPFLQLACVLGSYDDEKDPCLWKRQEAWDPHPFAEDQEPHDLVGQPQERWRMNVL